jgi:outer membrane protein
MVDSVATTHARNQGIRVNRLESFAFIASMLTYQPGSFAVMTKSKFIIANTLAVIAMLMSPLAYAEDEYNELDLTYPSIATQGEAPTKNWRGMLGAGVLVMQPPIEDTRTYALPLLAVTYRDTVYFHFGQAGVYVFKSEDRLARLALALKARRGYDPSDYPGLTGMQKRDTSIEAGLSGVWLTTSPLLIISYGYFSDVSDTTNGDSAQFGLAHPVRLTQDWQLIPSVGAQWLSSKVVNYYYGVMPSEATPSRPAYSGTASSNVRVGLMLHYRASRDWSLFGGVSYTRLGSGVSDSPIVIHDAVSALLVGGAWRF